MKDLSYLLNPKIKKVKSDRRKPERRTLASIEAYIQLLEKQVS